MLAPKKVQWKPNHHKKLQRRVCKKVYDPSPITALHNRTIVRLASTARKGCVQNFTTLMIKLTVLEKNKTNAKQKTATNRFMLHGNVFVSPCNQAKTQHCCNKCMHFAQKFMRKIKTHKRIRFYDCHSLRWF